MQRLLKKFDTAKALVPRPVRDNADKVDQIGVIYFGSTAPAMDEAIHLSSRLNGTAAEPRCGCAPSRSHERCRPTSSPTHHFVFVVEQNRDAQLQIADRSTNAASIRLRLVSVLHYDGTPITARYIAQAIDGHLDALKVTPLRKVVS